MPNYTKEKLGVIGGCGVAAANELMCRIERKLTGLGCTDDPQQPEIMLYQATLAPNRIAYANGGSDVSFAPYFIGVGKKLKNCGATICCIPCNTAHCEIERIESEVGLPFINIISETLKYIHTIYPNVKKIGILGSSGTNFSKIYQKHARKCGFDYEILFPDAPRQQEEDRGIAAVKSGLQYTNPAEAERYFIPSADEVLQNGAEVLVLGCTEIPLAVKRSVYKGIPVVDTISVLADACIRACKVA